MKYILFFLSISTSILNILYSIYLFSEDMCVINGGVSFGILIEYEVLISTLLVVFLIYISFRLKNSLRYIFLNIAILGIGNIIVRVILKDGICDYIHFLNISFNIVDIGIVGFSIYSIWYLLFRKGSWE